MFTALLSPWLRKIYPCAVEEVKHSIQKERRIIDTLEPVLNQHRLIVDKQVIKDDSESVKHYPMELQQQYSLFYQMTRITKDRGALSHDDRLDCLAMAVADCLDMLQVDPEEELQRRIEEELDREIERYEEEYGLNSDRDETGWFDLA